MKIKTGIDIIEVKRIEDSIKQHGEGFLTRVFTEKEIEYCESKKVNKLQSYAARFAAEEVVFKAISGAVSNKYEVNWQDIEILNDEAGRPYVNFSNKLQKLGLKNENIDVSLSHIKEQAIASAVLIVD